MRHILLCIDILFSISCQAFFINTTVSLLTYLSRLFQCSVMLSGSKHKNWIRWGYCYQSWPSREVRTVGDKQVRDTEEGCQPENSYNWAGNLYRQVRGRGPSNKECLQVKPNRRALYEYVRERYPDVYQEQKVKDIITNLVLVSFCFSKPLWSWK